MALVLLVEDESFVRNLYKIKLEMSEFRVETAADGLDGLEKARELRPDIILLDIILPRLDGIEVLRKLKSDPKLRVVPVLMLTNLDDTEHRKECSQVGAEGYIVKSAGTPNFVLNEVKRILC